MYQVYLLVTAQLFLLISKTADIHDISPILFRFITVMNTPFRTTPTLNRSTRRKGTTCRGGKADRARVLMF